MKSCISYGIPKTTFWKNYQKLWENCLHRSAFQSPSFIRFLADLAESDVAVYQHYEHGQLTGAAFFKNENGQFHFLSDLKADHNFFIISNQCTQEQIRSFFDGLLQAVKTEKWALLLDKQPSWAGYYGIMVEAIEADDVFVETSKYSNCLTLEAATPEDLKRSVNKQKLRQKLNRLKDLGEVVFEVFQDDEDLDEWLREFIESHIWRWENTATPSNLRESGRHEFFSQCMKAWIKDGLLVRFSLKLDEKRIGFVIGLRENDSIIHHSTTYNLDYHKYSPGLVLIRLMGQWMAEQNICKIDFGDGEESYKQHFSNNISEINRIYLSGDSNISFILKAKITKAVRENPNVHRFYLERIKPLVKRVFD